MAVYRSKVNFWGYFYLGFFVGLSVYFWSESNLMGEIIFTIFTVAYLWIFLNTKYVIGTENLSVLPFGPHIPLSQITRIEPAHNYFFSSPALSLKRLMIKFDKGSVFVSPVRGDAFIDELKQRCIHLKG